MPSSGGVGGGGGGVTDHGALTGLGDDDHPQYALDTDVVTDHGGLGGLGDDDHTQYALDSDLSAHLSDAVDAHPADAVGVDTSAFAGNLSAADDTVQKALDTLDDVSLGGGVTDHGALTGLGDDDHPQYALDTDLSDHISDATAAHAASAISADPTGHSLLISSTVEGQLDQADFWVDAANDAIAAHTVDATAAHAASAIGFTPNGSIAATDVQAAIQEVRDEASGGGVSDGDKGDVVVSSSGSVWTIDNDAVSNTKAANMAQATVKGRAAGAGTGDPTDLTPAQVLAIILAGITAGYSDGKTIDNSVTETSVLDATYSIASGPTIGDTYLVFISGHVFNDSGSATNRDVTFRFKLNSTTVCELTTGTFATNASNVWQFALVGFVTIRATGGAGVGQQTAAFTCSFPNAGSTGSGGVLGTAKSGVAKGTTTQATTSAITLDVTAQLGFQDVAFDLVIDAASIVRCPKA